MRRLPSVEGRDQNASEVATRTSQVLRGRYLPISVAICVASFMGLLLVYGLNTWLPKTMGEAGYSIKAGTGLLLALSIGAVIGLLVAGLLSDARGSKPTVLLLFGLAAVFLALLSIKLHGTTLVYAAVLLSGVFVFSSQVLVYAFVGHLYPPEVRGTALGMSAGVGRVGAIVGPSLGGALVTAGVAYPWSFYAFAVARCSRCSRWPPSRPISSNHGFTHDGPTQMGYLRGAKGPLTLPRSRDRHRARWACG